MYSFLKIFIVVVLALALIDWLADRDPRGHQYTQRQAGMGASFR